MKKYKILVMSGDGIGPEIVAAARKTLEAVSTKYSINFEFDEELVGGASIDKYGTALRDEALEKAKLSDAILFGAVGSPRFDSPTLSVRPEQALLKLREQLGLFANLRPVKLNPRLIDASPIKASIIKDTDILVIRELTSGIYFGRPRKRFTDEDGKKAIDTMSYSQKEVNRILHVAFKVAMDRKRHVTSVDKANVLDTSRLWREEAENVARMYPKVKWEPMLVDSCAMYLISEPRRFDVIVTSNMFGDILTDEASMLTGSLGLMPSASLGEMKDGETAFGMYEPIHGSAPDIAGKKIANPIGTILSAAMMLRLSFGLNEAATAIENAVNKTLDSGLRTRDIAINDEKPVNTDEITNAIILNL